MLNIKFVISLGFVSSCATLPKNASETKAAHVLTLPMPVPAKITQNIQVNYLTQKKTESAEVFICDNFAPQTVLLNHSDSLEFGVSNFCQASIAQVFLQREIINEKPFDDFMNSPDSLE